MNRSLIIQIALLLLGAVTPLCAVGPARYEAVFADGTRVEGERITGWGGRPGSPRLDGTPLNDSKRPLRWLRNHSLKPRWERQGGAAYIEFVGGDRFIGRVVGSRSARTVGGVYTPAHLLVSPQRAPNAHPHVRGPPPIRVLIGTVRRIVMTSTPRGYYRPGRLFRRDGGHVDFVGLRPGADSLNLLLTDSAVDVRLDNVAEVHFPKVDPWEAYFRMLGEMSPSCRSQMVRFETVGGLIATASGLRTLELPFVSDAYKERALQNLKRQDEHIARQEQATEQHETSITKAREDHAKESAKLDMQLQTARKAYEKARSDLKKRIEKDKQADSGRSDKDRAKLDQQRRKQLSDFETREGRKIKHLESDRTRRLAQKKSQVDRAISTLERHKQNIVRSKEHRKKSVGAEGDSNTWTHLIQPVWCLDALRVPFKSIYMRRSFRPDRIPLSMIRPDASISPALQPWRADRNLQGKSLRSGLRRYAWGFGVHAYSELSFTLPQCVNSFQAHLGLDSSVGGGGCARGKVFLGSTDRKPVYASPMLIGSSKTLSTGSIALQPSGGGGPRRLILQADTAHHGRPKGADPLNIRDKLNWLEPTVGFDLNALKDIARLRAVKRMRAWDGWDVKFDKQGSYAWTTHLWEDKPGGPARFLTRIRAEKRPLVISRRITVGPDDKWLIVDVGSLHSPNTFKHGAVSILINGGEVRPEPIPMKQDWRKMTPSPSFSISQHRGGKVTVEIRQPPDGKELYWHKADTSEELPGEYRLASILKEAGMAGAKIPVGLGWALQSDAVDEAGGLAMLEVYKSGAFVNFWNPLVRPFGANEFVNILVGDKWTGGDKGLVTLAKIKGLKSLLLAADSKVSDEAVEKLRATRPDITIRLFDRTPSALADRCRMVMKNSCDKDVMTYWVDFNGKHKYPRRLKPGANVHSDSRFGCRYEAYIDEKLIATYNVVPQKSGKAYVVWDIKPQ